MKQSLISELLLYKYRYLIGYGLLALCVSALLLTDFSSVPAGVSNAEMRSVVASNAINILQPQFSDMINAPYHLLQKASVSFLGLSNFSIRLPSLLLAIITAITLTVTLNKWFRSNVAMIASLIAITSVPFITISRNGTAAILYVLLVSFILYSASMLLTKRSGTLFGWKLLIVLSCALLLYMPLGIYALLALGVAAIFHPHIRHQLKKTKWYQYMIFAFLSALIVVPIAISVIFDPLVIATLLNGTAPVSQNILDGNHLAQLKLLATTLLSFGSPSIDGAILPFVSLPFALFVLIGLVKIIVDSHSARSYLIFVWLLSALPLLYLNPNRFTLILIPSILLLAIGIDTFMREWYKLFPRNPYARMAAFVPITLIVLGFVTIAPARYFYGYYYTDTTSTHQPELQAIRDSIEPQLTTRLIVEQDSTEFYDILRREYPLLTVATSETTGEDRQQRSIVLDRTDIQINKAPEKILSSSNRDKPVLLRVYNNTR